MEKERERKGKSLNTYGMPLEFKAVNLMDGTKTVLGELLELSDGAFVAAKTDSTELSNDVPNLEVYQSIGYSDETGRTLYFGGYVVNNVSVSDIMKAVLHNNQAFFESISTGVFYPVYSQQDTNDYCVVGSIYTPEEPIQRRAKKVRNV